MKKPVCAAKQRADRLFFVKVYSVSNIRS